MIIGLGAAYYWYVNMHYRFEVISDNRVFKSSLIPPDQLDDYLLDHHIKTVINLLDPATDDAENPGQMSDIEAEDAAIARINKAHGTNIQHINIPSGQVPTQQTLTKFFDVLDNNASYPVLIHCYHGMGRAVIYSALYRIEYEGWKNEDARMQARLLPIMVDSPLHRSSFAKGREKGDFLIGYTPRNQPNSTLEQLATQGSNNR